MGLEQGVFASNRLQLSIRTNVVWCWYTFLASCAAWPAAGAATRPASAGVATGCHLTAEQLLPPAYHTTASAAVPL